MLFGSSGAIVFYINLIVWFTGKEYSYPEVGPLAWFTWYWGFFVYWGALALVYSVMRLIGIQL
jgi:hypothetical protein